MSHKCRPYPRCLRNQGLRCEACKASRHPGHRLSSIKFVSDFKGGRDLERLERKAEHRAAMDATIQRFREKVRREEGKDE